VIPRYSVPEAAAIWSRQRRFELMMRVELALVEAWAEMGRVPPESAANICVNMAFTLERIDELEAITDHDVVAFVMALGESVGADARYIHMGATSSDMLDTATALQIQEAGALILADLDAATEAVRQRAIEHKHTPMMGRTHGVHAEPITFGLKLLTWFQELLRNRARIAAALEINRVGKVSGAVGSYTNLHPDLERAVCERLGLRPDPASTQVIARDRHAQYVLALAQLGASIERFATTIRSLQRTEIGELQEPFKAGQTGSSAMPHKKNPKSSEQLCGLSRVLRANAMAALEDVALWDERDISHSSVERIILPDSSILAVYMLRQFTRIVGGLVVNVARMRANIDRTGGAIFSGRLLAALTEKGLPRDEAYAIVQRLAIPAAEGGPPLHQAALDDPAVALHLDEGELAAIFDIDFYLQHIDENFARSLEE
jgi:adenylosuccinate lyase